MTGDLIDLLGAMGDYFDARRAHNEALAEHVANDGYSWDYHGASYIAALERAYERVETAWRAWFPSDVEIRAEHEDAAWRESRA